MRGATVRVDSPRSTKDPVAIDTQLYSPQTCDSENRKNRNSTKLN